MPPNSPTARVRTLLNEAQALQVQLQSYEAERKALAQARGVLTGTAANQRVEEIRSIGTRSRRLLRQFWAELAEIDHVDDLRVELRRFQADYLDEIDQASTHWINGFLRGLNAILRTACETLVEPNAAPGTASTPIRRKPGRPVQIPEVRKAEALKLWEDGKDPTEVARKLFKKNNPSRIEKNKVDPILKAYAKKLGRLPAAVCARQKTRAEHS